MFTIWDRGVAVGRERTVTAGGHHCCALRPPYGKCLTGSSTTSLCRWPRPAASTAGGHAAFWHGMRAGRVSGWLHRTRRRP